MSQAGFNWAGFKVAVGALGHRRSMSRGLPMCRSIASVSPCFGASTVLAGADPSPAAPSDSESPPPRSPLGAASARWSAGSRSQLSSGGRVLAEVRRHGRTVRGRSLGSKLPGRGNAAVPRRRPSRFGRRSLRRPADRRHDHDDSDHAYGPGPHDHHDANRGTAAGPFQRAPHIMIAPTHADCHWPALTLRLWHVRVPGPLPVAVGAFSSSSG
jgi:hypothetical protein